MNLFVPCGRLRHNPASDIGFAISVFDHWLAESEITSDTLMSYRGAIELGRVEEYLEQEQRFLSLYRNLARGGVSPMRQNGQLGATLAPNSARFIEILRASLREWHSMHRRRMRDFDLYFHEPDVRVFGSWDRTDHLYYGRNTDVAGVKKAVLEAGLFVLDRGT